MTGTTSYGKGKLRRPLAFETSQRRFSKAIWLRMVYQGIPVGKRAEWLTADRPKRRRPAGRCFFHYKQSLIRAIALDRAARQEEKQARRKHRRIDPEEIERLAERHLRHVPYKSTGARFHSFVVYVSNLRRLGWIEFTGKQEKSVFQDHHPPGPPRRYYRLTEAGKAAPEEAWRNHFRALYGR